MQPSVFLRRRHEFMILQGPLQMYPTSEYLQAFHPASHGPSASPGKREWPVPRGSSPDTRNTSGERSLYSPHGVGERLSPGVLLHNPVSA